MTSFCSFDYKKMTDPQQSHQWRTQDLARGGGGGGGGGGGRGEHNQGSGVEAFSFRRLR